MNRKTLIILSLLAAPFTWLLESCFIQLSIFLSEWVRLDLPPHFSLIVFFTYLFILYLCSKRIEE